VFAALTTFIFADVPGYIPWVSAFGSILALMLGYLLTKVDGGISAWVKGRRIKKESTLIVLVGRVDKLEAESLAKDAVLKAVDQFIRGTPDPYLTLPDGSPVMNGGLLKTLDRLEKKFSLGEGDQ
jgi:hypothetical protein